MSYAYSLLPPPPPIKMNLEYGYQKVNKSQLEEIINRMQQPTYTSNQHIEEVSESLPYRSLPSRPTSSRCRKVNLDKEWITSEGHWAVDRYPRPLSPRSVDRLVERLQAPTESLMSAHNVTSQLYYDGTTFEEDRPTMSTFVQRSDGLKLTSTNEHHETQRRIRRPTTASSRKRYDVCVVCQELGPAKQRCANYDYMEQPKVPSLERVSVIFQRVQSPTKASKGGKDCCSKYPGGCPCQSQPIGHSKRVPRIKSATTGSKNVEEIVARLFKPTQTIPISGNKSSLCYGWKRGKLPKPPGTNKQFLQSAATV